MTETAEEKEQLLVSLIAELEITKIDLAAARTERDELIELLDKSEQSRAILAPMANKALQRTDKLAAWIGRCGQCGNLWAERACGPTHAARAAGAYNGARGLLEARAKGDEEKRRADDLAQRHTRRLEKIGHALDCHMSSWPSAIDAIIALREDLENTGECLAEERTKVDKLERRLAEPIDMGSAIAELTAAKDAEVCEAETQAGIARSLATLLGIKSTVPDFDLTQAARYKLNELKDAVEAVLENAEAEVITWSTSTECADLIEASRELGWRK